MIPQHEGGDQDGTAHQQGETPPAGGGGRGLRGMLVSELPPPDRTHELVAALHQRAWALKLQALMMLRMDEGAAVQVGSAEGRARHREGHRPHSALRFRGLIREDNKTRQEIVSKT